MQAPWCTPNQRGVTPEDRANLDHYVFNDLDSVVAAAERAGDDTGAAHTDGVIDRAHLATDEAFATVASAFGHIER